MYIIVMGGGEEAVWWVEQIENQGEDCRCEAFARAEDGLMAMHREPDGVILLNGAAPALLREMTAHPPVEAPYLWGVGAPDGNPPAPMEMAQILRRLRREGPLPVLALGRFPEARRLAAALLTAMGAPRLKAMAFLPEMMALCALHPALQRDLQHGLYPRIAGEMGLTPSAVERRLRLWIEATWSRGDLAAIERFFGSTVDPEKGKPTNREFLCGAAAWVRRGLKRLQGEE